MSSSETAKEQFLEEQFVLRDRSTHENHCTSLEGSASHHFSLTYGVTRKSILQDVNHFSVAGETLAHDIMHNLLEGVLPYETKALLKYCLQMKYFSLEVLINDSDTFSLNTQKLGASQSH